jgi:S1-C subfamily serine protease
VRKRRFAAGAVASLIVFSGCGGSATIEPTGLGAVRQAVVRLAVAGSQLDMVTVSSGSGLIVSESGQLLTAYHVIAGGQVISVEHDGETLPATVVGRSPCDDLAVLQIEPQPGVKFPWVPISQGEFDLGTEVVAIGYPEGGESQALTAGIVSRTGERLDTRFASVLDTIQTDAAINPGASGGPLATKSGDVIGINIASYDAGYLENVGVAVSATTIHRVLPQLQGGQDIGWMGITGEAVGSETASILGLPTGGVFVMDVERGSVGANAGFRAGDLILSYGGQPLIGDSTLRTFCSVMAAANPLSAHHVEVYRNGYLHEGAIGGARLTRKGTLEVAVPGQSVTPTTAPATSPKTSCEHGSSLWGALDPVGLRLPSGLATMGASADTVIAAAIACLGPATNDEGWQPSTYELGGFWCYDARLERTLTWRQGEGYFHLYFVQGGRLSPDKAVFVGYWHVVGDVVGLTTGEGIRPGLDIDEWQRLSPTAAIKTEEWGTVYAELGPDVYLPSAGWTVRGLIAILDEDGSISGISLGPYCE